MTSTNINFGISETKNSSRVLKPPGGGHSDIFGIYEDTKPKPHPVKGNAPKSTIGEVFCMDDDVKKTDKTDNKEIEQKINEHVEKENGEKENGEKENGEKENGEKENGEKENGEKENGEKENVDKENGDKLHVNEAPKPIPATPQRVRVPPGGFSSGLW